MMGGPVWPPARAFFFDGAVTSSTVLSILCRYKLFCPLLNDSVPSPRQAQNDCAFQMSSLKDSLNAGTFGLSVKSSITAEELMRKLNTTFLNATDLDGYLIIENPNPIGLICEAHEREA